MKARPVVLHCITSLKTSGTTQLLLNNLRYFDSSRYEHRVVYFLPRHEERARLLSLGVEPVFLRHSRSSAVMITLRRLLREIKRVNVGLIHTNLALDNIYGRAAGLLAGVPVLRTLVDSAEPNVVAEMSDGKHESALVMGLQRMERFTADRFVAVSSATKAVHAKHYGVPEKKVDVVYSGLDLQSLAASYDSSSPGRLRAHLNLVGMNGPLLLSVGRLHWCKGHRYLIPMMERLLTRYPSAKLLIAGEGEERGNLEGSIAERGLQNAIILLGRRDDVPALLRLADVFVFPSVSEALGYGVLEAMAVGVPVVAADVGGVSEAVHHRRTGLLVKSQAPDDLADAVEYLLENAEVAKGFAQAAREYVHRHFDAPANVLALEEVYQDMLGPYSGADKN